MPKLAPTTFADWLLLKRRKKGIRQEDLAKALAISHQTVSSWETGRGIPKLNPRQMKILCEMLGCAMEELAEAFGESDLETQFERDAG
jgi:DNA-binding XRE family transcriptional regulator